MDINEYVKSSLQNLNVYDKKIDRLTAELNELKIKRDRYYKRILADMLKRCNIPIESFCEMVSEFSQQVPKHQNNRTEDYNGQRTNSN